MKPIHNKFSAIMISILCAATIACSAPSIKKTGLLQAKQGYIGENLGAKVQRVKFDPETDITEIVVSIPSLGEDTNIDKVTNADEKPLVQAKAYRIQKDADGEPTGVILYLKKNNQLPFRIYFSDGQSE